MRRGVEREEERRGEKRGWEGWRAGLALRRTERKLSGVTEVLAWGICYLAAAAVGLPPLSHSL